MDTYRDIAISTFIGFIFGLLAMLPFRRIRAGDEEVQYELAQSDYLEASQRIEDTRMEDAARAAGLKMYMEHKKEEHRISKNPPSRHGNKYAIAMDFPTLMDPRMYLPCIYQVSDKKTAKYCGEEGMKALEKIMRDECEKLKDEDKVKSALDNVH